MSGLSKSEKAIHIASFFSGQIIGGVLALCGMYASYKLAMAGHDGVATAFAVTTISSVVIAFVAKTKLPGIKQVQDGE